MNQVLTRLRRHWLLAAGLAAIAAVLGLWVAYAEIAPGSAVNFVDLNVYTDGGLILRHMLPGYHPHGSTPLYSWGGLGSLQLKFTYTPFAAVAFVVVTLIPWHVARNLSVAVNVIALVAALWFTYGGLGYRNREIRAGAALLTAAAVFWTEPVLRTIYLGQINLLLMALIIWDLCQPSEGRWWKGAATGVAAGIKLVPLIFIPYLLITRRFREAVAACVGFIVTVLVGFALLPGDSVKWWFDGLFAQGSRAGFMGWAGNQSLRGLITRLSGSVAAGVTPWLVIAALTAVAGLACAAMLYRAGHPMPALLATELTGDLISPISWDHHWVWIAPAVAVAAHYGVRYWRVARAWAVGFLTLAAGIVAVFAAWPTRWFGVRPHLGKDSYGLIWEPPNTSPGAFVRHGDLPGNAEYHWHGLQLLTGNAYVLAALALLAVLLFVSARITRQGLPAPGERQEHDHDDEHQDGRVDRVPGLGGDREHDPQRHEREERSAPAPLLARRRDDLVDPRRVRRKLG
jgi:alpha-1,2-mannosyltransferase